MFSLNSANSVTKIFVIKVKGFEPATFCVRDQDATTAPAHMRDTFFVLETRMLQQRQHTWETGSLNSAQFMLQSFIRFPEFTEFNESSASFRKNSIVTLRNASRTDFQSVTMYNVFQYNADSDTRCGLLLKYLSDSIKLCVTVENLFRVISIYRLTYLVSVTILIWFCPKLCPGQPSLEILVFLFRPN